MKFKVTADVPGEPKSRCLFAPTERTASDCVSIMLSEVPVGTVVQKWETVDRLVGSYSRKEDTPQRRKDDPVVGVAEMVGEREENKV